MSTKTESRNNEAAQGLRAPGVEGCPGCVGVEVHGQPCEMNAIYCCIAWFIANNARRVDRNVIGGDDGRGADKRG